MEKLQRARARITERTKYPHRSKDDSNDDLMTKAENLMTAHGVPEVQHARGLQDFYNMLKEEGYSKSQRKIYIDNKIATIKRMEERTPASKKSKKTPVARKSRSVSPVGYGSPKTSAPPPLPRNVDVLDLTETQSTASAPRSRTQANEEIAIAKSGHGGMAGILKEYDAGDKRVPKAGGTKARTAQYLAGEARGHPAGLPSGKKRETL